MVEEQRARIDEAMTKMMDDIDKAFIRDLQGKMFKCAAACCDDKESSVQTVQSCIEVCSRPLQKTQQYVQTELNRFYERIQRCVMSCNDTIRDKVGPEASETEISKYTKEFEKCAKKCVDFHIDVIPNTLKHMKYKLKSQVE